MKVGLRLRAQAYAHMAKDRAKLVQYAILGRPIAYRLTVTQLRITESHAFVSQCIFVSPTEGGTMVWAGEK